MASAHSLRGFFLTQSETNSLSKNRKTCPYCRGSFVTTRRNQKFCTPKCRKLSSQREIREKSPINSTNSHQKWRENVEIFDKALRWAEMYYTMPPSDRSAFLDTLLDCAANNIPKVRTILGMPKLLRANREEPNLFWRKCPAAHRTISQLVSAHCSERFGISYKTWIKGVQASV